MLSEPKRVASVLAQDSVTEPKRATVSACIQTDVISTDLRTVERLRSFQGWISVKANLSFMCNGKNNELPDSQPEIACRTV